MIYYVYVFQPNLSPDLYISREIDGAYQENSDEFIKKTLLSELPIKVCKHSIIYLILDS